MVNNRFMEYKVCHLLVQLMIRKNQLLDANE